MSHADTAGDSAFNQTSPRAEHAEGINTRTVGTPRLITIANINIGKIIMHVSGPTWCPRAYCPTLEHSRAAANGIILGEYD